MKATRLLPLLLAFFLLLSPGISRGQEQDRVTFYTRIGDIYLQRGDARTALGLYQRALRLDPWREQAVAGAASALVLLNEPERALDELDAYLARYPERALARYTRGQVRLLIGWISGAYRDLKKAYELSPTEAAYALAFARVALILGRKEEVKQAVAPFLKADAAPEAQREAQRLLYILYFLYDVSKSDGQGEGARVGGWA